MATAMPSVASPRPSRASYALVAELIDRSDDQGLDGPGYGDLRRVLLEDDGSNARLVVAVGAALPSPTATRESLGVGIDLFATAGQTESDYQLFADGGPDGWFAYLHTPRGFVRYPGSFAVTGDRLVFTVPWSSLGGWTSGRLSAFADWTQGGTTGSLGGNKASRDEAPVLGSQAWSR